MSANDEQRRRMCEGKVRHRTAVEAGQFAEALFQRTGMFARVYGPCKFCRGWHIGGSGLAHAPHTPRVTAA